MTLREKKGGWYWGKDGPFESSSYARKFGAAKYIRGEEYIKQLAQDADPLNSIEESEIRDAWSRLVADQAKRKITQQDAEILAAILTSELINRNQADSPKEEKDTNLLTEKEPLGKSEVSKEEIATSCLSCTDSHWSTISGVLNEAVRLARQGYALDSEDIMSRISLAKEELNTWERLDASPDKLENSAEFIKDIVRKMVSKGAQLRHSMAETGLGFGKGTIDGLESAASFAKQASREFERELNANGVCTVQKQMPREVNTLVVAKESVKGDKMFSYEVAIGPISKEWANTVGIGQRGELLETGNSGVEKQVERLLEGTLLTSQLILKAILLKHKVAKNEVDYVDVSPSSDRCATCKSFIKEEGPSDPARKLGECVKVLGKISPRGRCKLFERGWGPARSPATGQVRLDDSDTSYRLSDDDLVPQSKNGSKGAIEIDGKYYLRLARVNSDIDAPEGGILRIALEDVEERGNDGFKSFIIYLPKGKEFVVDKAVPDLPEVLERLVKQEPEKADYSSRRLNIARKLFENDQLVEAVELLNQEVADTNNRNDRGTMELWAQYSGVVNRIQNAMQNRAPELNNLLRIADEIYREGERTTTKFNREDGGVATVESTGFVPTFGGQTYGEPNKKKEEPDLPDAEIDLAEVIERELANRGIVIENADDIKLSVKAIIRKGNKVLILKDAHSDYWDLPGGHVQEGEKLEDALAREVREETRLLISNPASFKTEIMKLGEREKPVIFYFASARGDVKLSDEHTDYKWITPDEIEEYNLGQFSHVLKEEANENSKSKFEKMIIELATREGLVPKKVQVTREGKTFVQTIWIRPEEATTGEPQGAKAAPPPIDLGQEKQIFQEVISKLRGERPTQFEPLEGTFTSNTMENLKDNADDYLSQFEKFFDATTYNKVRDTAYRLITTGSRVPGRFNPTQLQELVTSSIDKLIYQEVRAWERQLGDHGIRHIWSNIDFQNRILTAMGSAGIKITDEDRFLVNLVMINHDLGYTVGEARTSLQASKFHPEYSRQWFESERDFFGKYFSEDQLDEMEHYILNHDQANIDWEEQPLLSALSTADNLSLFHEEKLPSLFRYVDGSIDSLFDMQRAIQRNDDAGIEKARQELFAKVDQSTLPKFTKSWLKQAAGGVSKFTPKFTIPMLVGHVSAFDFSSDTGLEITVQEDPFESKMADFFDMGQGQYVKFAETYGAQIANNDDITFAKGGKQLIRLRVKRNPITKELELIAELDDPSDAIMLSADYIHYADREGLVPKKVQVTRGGKTFEQTVYIRPEEEVKTKDHPTVAPETRRMYAKFSQLSYNSLLNPRSMNPTTKASKVIKELIDEQHTTRERVMGREASSRGYWLVDDWVEGKLPNIVGIRMMVAEMRGETLDREAIRSQLNSIFGKPQNDEFIDNVIGFAETFMMSLGPDMKPTTEPTKEVLKKEREFAVQRAKELFGDEMMLYRGIYGPTATKIKEKMAKDGEVELDEFSLSSYSQDPMAAAAFVYKKGDFIVIKRKVKTDDVFLGWFSNPAFIGSMPEQKEVLISPQETKFKIGKEDIWM